PAFAPLDPGVLDEGTEKAPEPEFALGRVLKIGADGVPVQRPDGHCDRLGGDLELDADLVRRRIRVAFEDGDEGELQVFESLVGEVVSRGEAAYHEARDPVEGAFV